jgi:hypothetical protein
MSGKYYRIAPPPGDAGSQPLFRVVYVIDVNAADPRAAAELVHRIMTDPRSMPPVLQVIDFRGKVVEIDLGRQN